MHASFEAPGGSEVDPRSATMTLVYVRECRGSDADNCDGESSPHFPVLVDR
jgi:hypothetical protein